MIHWAGSPQSRSLSSRLRRGRTSQCWLRILSRREEETRRHRAHRCCDCSRAPCSGPRRRLGDRTSIPRRLPSSSRTWWTEAGCEVTGLQEERVRFRKIGIVDHDGGRTVRRCRRTVLNPPASNSRPLRRPLLFARRSASTPGGRRSAHRGPTVTKRLRRSWTGRYPSVDKRSARSTRTWRNRWSAWESLRCPRENTHARSNSCRTRSRIREATLSANDVAVGESLMDLGTVYQVRGDYVRPEALYQRALAIYEKAGQCPDALAGGPDSDGRDPQQPWSVVSGPG